jgi:hypothetical protein
MEHFIIEENSRRRAVPEAWAVEHQAKYRQSQQFVKRIGISAVTAASRLLAIAVGYTSGTFKRHTTKSAERRLLFVLLI